MNISGINLTPNATYPLYTHKKEKANEDKSFANILEAYSAEQDTPEQVTEYTASADEIQAIADAEGEKISNAPSYTVTDEEAKYLREKYGENYDEEHLSGLFYELAEKGIISDSDAYWASGIGCIRKVEGYGPNALELFSKGLVQLRAGEKYYIRDIAYDNAYEKFDRDYTNDVDTWEDFIQKRLDFVEYLQSCDVLYDPDGNPYNCKFDFSNWHSSVERAAEIIKRIFG